MTRTNDLIAGSFTAIVGNMYQQGVAEALPWIFAMTAVVVADSERTYAEVLYLGKYDEPANYREATQQERDDWYERTNEQDI